MITKVSEKWLAKFKLSGAKNMEEAGISSLENKYTSPYILMILTIFCLKKEILRCASGRNMANLSPK